MLTTAFLVVLTIIYTIWSISHFFQAIFKLFAFPSVFGGHPILVWLAFIIIFLRVSLVYVILLLIISIIFGRRLLSFMGLFTLELSFLTMTLVCILRATHTWFSFTGFPPLEQLSVEYAKQQPLVDTYLNFFRDLIPPIANVDFSIPVAVTIISIPYIILKTITDQMYKTARDKKNMSKASREGPEKPQGQHENRRSQKQIGISKRVHKSPDSIFQEGFSKNRD